MKIYNSITDFIPSKKTVVTLGTFDGVHVGHRKIIDKLIQNAKELECESLILTFFPHPRMVLQDKSEIKLLNTLDEKIDLLDKTGLDILIVHPFDAEFSRLTAEEFVSDILVDKFNIQKIIIGYDHRFGRNRTADITDLIQFGKEYNFEVEQISAQEVNAVSVSSTKIRHALQDGHIDLANHYLNYNYSLTGTVIEGKQLGRTINFPTANIDVAEDYKLIPAIGVYIVKCQVGNETVFGMMNIGTRPTVSGESISTEVHFFNFNDNLYGKKLTVEILHRIRDERKFESVSLLKEQLEADKIFSQNWIKQNL